MHPLDVRDDVLCLVSRIHAQDPDFLRDVQADNPILDLLPNRRRFCRWVRRHRRMARRLVADLEIADRVSSKAEDLEDELESPAYS